ncbi:conserved hypothetical protein [Leishmania infantum JPCM5]|uniref:Uncharacterized protein n=2 Tax=Leishmania infantum TaxID=5671 RepID=A4HWD7_LEIIN|nr:conserved hypothetical protein [Leishmania infantum JPCM5]CAC9471358.1 hypothetical_protein_-_conserved [Leishmania infantum]CAM66760.1 conserved hypothetical protein [Leishmania infantum JPCM5]SUZ40431.1 hypothetical_protein_-_conserved [Leishmania infantum]|eukprot:XP_001464378.1 conserved hypothetical protein [Leishmania infantum JPCM5]
MGAPLDVLSGGGGSSVLLPAARAGVRRRRQNSRCAPSLFVTLLALALLSAVRVSAFSDPFEQVPNAFQTTGTAVRAVYEAAQLTRSNPAWGSQRPLRSDSYVLCVANGGGGSGGAANSSSTAVDLIARAWCTESGKGILVKQSVFWSMLASPGLQLSDSSMVSSRALSWDCLTYSCDMENTIVAHATVNASSSSTDVTYTSPLPAVGGLGVSTPCCGSTNSTFVLYMTRGLLVQSATLPVTALNNEAAALYSAFIDAESARDPLGERSNKNSSGGGGGSGADRAEAVTAKDLVAGPSRSKEMDFCLVRQLAPSFYARSARSDRGDGGAVFAVNASICGADISDRINEQDATLVMRGYTAVLTAAEGVEALSFPKELIVGIASWIASTRHNASCNDDAKQSLLRTKGCCKWGWNASQATAYRTGEYLECLFDTSMLAHLPPLVLSLRNESIVSTAETNSTCSIALQLNSCVSPDGNALRFYSTGSLVDELNRHRHSLKNFHEPAIVVGVQQLRGATVAVTRSARVAKWFIGTSNAGYNLALLYLAVPRGTAVAADVSAAGALCVAKTVCSTKQTFYASLNRCAYVPCTRVLFYSFHADTFTCTPRTACVSIVAALCFSLLVAESVVLHLRRRTELAKEEHMRLLLQVQRRNIEAQ